MPLPSYASVPSGWRNKTPTLLKFGVLLLEAFLLLNSWAALYAVTAQSLRIFDAPGSTEKISSWLIVGTVILGSLLLGLVAPCGAVSHFRRNYLISIAYSALPLIVVGVLFVILSLL